jgi:hypothetical protein
MQGNSGPLIKRCALQVEAQGLAKKLDASDGENERNKNMNANTLKAVTQHGEALLRAFPNAIEKNPVALCKKLRRIESAIGRPILDYTNGENGMQIEQLDALCSSAEIRACKLLGMGAPDYIERIGNTLPGLFINRDPRGHALKLDDGWTREFNAKQYAAKLPALHTDMGGYGIIAPDLNQ